MLRNIHLSDILNAFSTVSPNVGVRLDCKRFCTFLLKVVYQKFRIIYHRIGNDSCEKMHKIY